MLMLLRLFQLFCMCVRVVREAERTKNWSVRDYVSWKVCKHHNHDYIIRYHAGGQNITKQL